MTGVFCEAAISMSTYNQNCPFKGCNAKPLAALSFITSPMDGLFYWR